VRPVRPLALLLLALVVVGCLAGPPPPSEGAREEERQGFPSLAFGPSVGMAQPSGGAEPNLAVLPDGTIFITAVAGGQDRPNALEGAAWLWRSRDGGQSWQTLREPIRDSPFGTVSGTRRPFGSSDADVVATTDGWVYYTDWWNWGAPVAGTHRVGNYLVERSRDGGETWQSAPVTIPEPANIDRQWLLAREGGFIGLFWSGYNHPETLTARERSEIVNDIQGVFSRNHGESWSLPVVVAPPKPNYVYLIAHPFWLPSGEMVVPYAAVFGDYLFDPGEAAYAISADDGRTWTQHAIAPIETAFEGVWPLQGAADAAGRMYVAWQERRGEHIALLVSTSNDKGRTWTSPHAIASEGVHGLPWVAAQKDGHVTVGWYGGASTGDPRQAPADAQWFAYAADSRDAGATWTIAKVSDEPVKVGPFCLHGAACASDRELLDYVSVTFGPDERLHYAFARSREVGGVKIGHVHYAGQAP